MNHNRLEKYPDVNTKDLTLFRIKMSGIYNNL